MDKRIRFFLTLRNLTDIFDDKKITHIELANAKSIPNLMFKAKNYPFLDRNII